MGLKARVTSVHPNWKAFTIENQSKELQQLVVSGPGRLETKGGIEPENNSQSMLSCTLVILGGCWRRCNVWGKPKAGETLNSRSYNAQTAEPKPLRVRVLSEY